MALFATERSGDGTITLTPQNEADQSALMVICHGLGDTAEGFADAAEASVVAVVLRLYSYSIISSCCCCCCCKTA